MTTPSTPTRSTAATGWYPDPLGVADVRFWAGTHWTCWIVAGGIRGWDSATTEWLLRDPEIAKRYEQLTVIRSYVESSANSGELSRAAADELLTLLMRQIGDLFVPQLPTPQPLAFAVSPTASTPPSAPAVPAPSVMLTQPQVGPAARVPSSQALLTSLRRRFVVDVGVHWLAYLGVLLLFVGVFGLVVFAFADVQRPLRPLAELAVPVATFGGAWFMARQGLRYVAWCLELVGGALLPIAVIAAFSDGASWPPDPSATARPLTLALATAAVAAGYAVVARRRPGSPVRFLAAPTLWLAAAMAALALRDPVPSGEDIASPAASQVAVVAVAVVVSLLLVRLRRLAYLRAATERTAIVGLPVVVVLAGATAPAHGWPSWPLVVTGVALAAAAELLAARIDRTIVAVVQLGGLALAVAAAPLDLSATARAAAVAIAALALAVDRLEPGAGVAEALDHRAGQTPWQCDHRHSRCPARVVASGGLGYVEIGRTS